MLGAVAILAAAAPNAHALIDKFSQLPVEKQQVWQSFQQYLAGQGQPNALSPSQQEQFQRLVDDYKRTSRGGGVWAQSRAQRLWTKMRTFGTRVNGLLGRLPIGSTIAMGSISFSVGYFIGTQANRMLLGFGTPTWEAPEAVSAVSLVANPEGSYPGGGDIGAEMAPGDGYAVKAHMASGGTRYHFSDTGTDLCSGLPVLPSIGTGPESRGPTTEGAMMIGFSTQGTVFCPFGSPQNEGQTLPDPKIWLFVPMETLPQTRPTEPYDPEDPDHSPDESIELEMPTPQEVADLPTDITTEIEKPANADVEKYALFMLDTDPETGGELHQDPFVEYVPIPQPQPGETYDAYIGRLEDAGLVGQAQELTTEQADANKESHEVVTVSPEPGTEVQIGSTVTVRHNPDLGDGGGVGGDWTAPEISAIDLSPLAEAEIGCNQFPFGIFCWIGTGLTSWNSAASCPTFTVPFSSGELVFDFCDFEPAMEIVRPVIVLLGVLSLTYLFAMAAMGIGAPANED